MFLNTNTNTILASIQTETQHSDLLHFLQDPEKLDLVGDLYHMNFVCFFRSAVLLHFCSLYSISDQWLQSRSQIPLSI